LVNYRWTPELDRLMAEWRAVSDQHDEAYEAAGRPSSFRGRNDSLKIRIRETFAQLHGWRYTDQPFSVRSLKEGRRKRDGWPGWYPSDAYATLFDHADFFCRERRPIAIVGHPYVDRATALACAAELDLAASVLPGSWYYPGHTIGVLITANDDRSTG
jgi:hypothetical protein